MRGRIRHRCCVALTVVFALPVAATAVATERTAPEAQAGAAVPTAEIKASVPVTSAVRYAFTNGDSSLRFVGAKITSTHTGSFGAFRGAVLLVGNDPVKSSVQIEIDTMSLMVEPEALAKHLTSPDFLDVQRFPKATFSSTSVHTSGNNGATYTVTGNLSLHGVVRAITFPATIQVAGNGVDVGAEFVINRKDFGVVYPGLPDDLIKNDVTIKTEIHAHRP